MQDTENNINHKGRIPGNMAKKNRETGEVINSTGAWGSGFTIAKPGTREYKRIMASKDTAHKKFLEKFYQKV